MNTTYRYEIEPHPAAMGGGWRLRLFDGEKEVGGGLFPPILYGPEFDDEAASRLARADAQKVGENWVIAMERP